MAKELLFKVIERSTGHEYRIFTNGEVEGFSEGVIVVNYFDVVATAGDQTREHLQQQESRNPEAEHHKE
jgi:hypothetical protein